MSGASTPQAPSSRAATTITDAPVNKHLPTAVELQRLQLAKLLKNPDKPVHMPEAPKEKTLRAPREMMKNVQGSSAGAGSGEFHVYKQNRRREYERIKLMDEKAKREVEAQDFETRKQEREEQTSAKTNKNRAKRQKKKARAKASGTEKKTEKGDGDSNEDEDESDSGQLKKKRRVVGGDGKQVVFRRPGEDAGEQSEDEDKIADINSQPENIPTDAPAIAEPTAIVIHDDD